MMYACCDLFSQEAFFFLPLEKPKGLLELQFEKHEFGYFELCNGMTLPQKATI